jgi:hypothetical protein
MRIYRNIKLLDVSNAKLLAIAAYRNQSGQSVRDSKVYVEQLLEQGIMEFNSYSNPFLEGFIREYFSYEFEVVDEPVVGMDYKRVKEPDAETQKALDWYALRLPFEKEYIEKIIAWEKRGMTYPAMG